MSGSQKTLRVFGIIEIISAVLNAVSAFQGAATSWLTVASSLLAGYLLLAAAKNPENIMPAWIITLVSLILSVLGTILVLTSGGDVGTIVGEAIALVLNLVAFIAANNVKKQVKK